VTSEYHVSGDPIEMEGKRWKAKAKVKVERVETKGKNVKFQSPKSK
jgi:hypothetical protein